MFLPSSMQAWVCAQPTDMRRSYDGLCMLARTVILQEPTSGHLFVFFGRRRDAVKVLYWDGTGFCIWSKRLEAGTFAPVTADENSGSIQLDRAGLLLLLEGVDLAQTKKRKLFHLQLQT